MRNIRRLVNTADATIHDRNPKSAAQYAWLMRVSVNERRQSASGASYVVIFALDLTVVEGSEAQLEVHEAAVHEEDTRWRDLVDEAVDQIQAGLQDVCDRRRLGVDAVLVSLRVHPVDFKPWKYRQCADHELTAMLDSTTETS